MDIVERLRERTATWVSVGWDNDDIFDDAANEIERLQKENELLQKEVKKHLTYQDHRHGRIGTHDPICYEYGPRHYECALREIDKLRDALRWAAPYVKDDPRVSAIIKAALKDEIQCATDENQ